MESFSLVTNAASRTLEIPFAAFGLLKDSLRLLCRERSAFSGQLNPCGRFALNRIEDNIPYLLETYIEASLDHSLAEPIRFLQIDRL